MINPTQTQEMFLHVCCPTLLKHSVAASFQMPQEFLIVSLLTSEVDASQGREV